jgi:hypothetical protein
MMARVPDGRVIPGHIRHGISIEGLKLKGVATNEPAVKVRLERPDPHTGWLFKWKKPMRPPTDEELEKWARDRFISNEDKEEFWLEDVEVLTTLPFCGNCELPNQAAHEDDFLCVYCRHKDES